MAIAKTYPLDKLMRSLHNYQQKTNRRITFEYCMIRDLNDSDQDARALARLIKPLKAGINLIEYNPHDNCRFKASTAETIQRFKDLLTQAGFETIIRFKRGRSIKAACGQLGADLLNKPQQD
jgi:23S rRNA (adenine2503-C2)-methyltransferase